MRVMLRMELFVVTCLAAAVVGWPGSALAQKRIALLIGNQSYAPALGALKNPHNDINLVGGELEKVGFEVMRVKDAGLAQINRTVNGYIRRLNAAGPDAIGFFYYAGHGAQQKETATNYLIPVDVETVDATIWDGSVRLKSIIDALKDQAPNATHFVVFDACRNSLRLMDPGSRALVQARGFEPERLVAGMLIAYATAEGDVASDVGEGAGPYARALAQEIGKPDIEAVTMFRNVQLKVKQSIKQDPWLAFPSLPPIYFYKDPPGTRIALLIGNQGYFPAVGPLKNPHGDVDIVGQSLSKTGFVVLPPVKDATREQMLSAVYDFAENLKEGGEGAIGFFYYAGHGVALNYYNYLIPVDFGEGDVRRPRIRGVQMDDIVGTLRETAPDAVVYLVFDAARVAVGSAIGRAQGFMPALESRRMMIAYSTAPGLGSPGLGASDGLYAKVLAGQLVKREQTDLAMFNNVQAEVGKQSSGYQVPWNNDSITRSRRIRFGTNH